MGVAKNVNMNVCNVKFDGKDLGYTKGGVKVSFSADTVDKEVDQEDAPIGEVITKQNFEVTVPLAEYDLERFASILPGCTLTKDASDPTKMKLVMSGAAGGDMIAMAKELILTPKNGSPNDTITVHNAIPTPKLEFTYDKNNVRIYEVTFKAMVGETGFVTWGDQTVVGA